MSSGKSGDRSRLKLARANRLRFAAEASARAMKEVASEAIAVRKNMDRLRELRLAREAASVQARIASIADTIAKLNGV